VSEDPAGRDTGQAAYVESQVIMTTVQVIAPFSLAYGLFLMFHGSDTPGGSFQGGAVIGATVLMIAFAFGIEPTRDWLRNRTVVGLAAGGTATFALVGLVPMLFGDSFLAHPAYDEQLGIATKWGLEAIEIGGVAPIVAGIVVGLFFVIAAGTSVEEGSDSPGSDGRDTDDSGRESGPETADPAPDGGDR
jgi:multicomponent Na+:H+ antiporter subunit B